MAMKINDILDVILGLAKSQGCWGRLYVDLMEQKEYDPEGWKETVKELEDEQFETLLDVVLYFEEGRHCKGSPKRKLIGYGVNIKLPEDDSFTRYATFGVDKKSLAMEEFYHIQNDNIEYLHGAQIDVEEIYLTDQEDYEYEVIAKNY